MILIVGLGNVGSRYARTRHNAGFMVVDRLAERTGAGWKDDPKLKARIATAVSGAADVVMVKPGTMMNGSGEAVQRAMQRFRVAPQDVWVVFDDVDTPFGKARVRHGGTSSGHQGVKSVMAHCGDRFVRIKFGVSLNDRAVEPSEVYVLKPFNDAERAVLDGYVDATVDVLMARLQDGIEDMTVQL